MRKLISILVCTGMVYGSVDIVSCPPGAFVAWMQDGGVRLADIGGSQDTLDFDMFHPTLGTATMEGESRLVLTTSDYQALVDDSVFLIAPSPLSVVSCRAIASTDLCWLSIPDIVEGSIRAARHQKEDDAFYISADAYLPISGDMECNVMSARLACDTAGDIYVTDTLGVSIDSYAGTINSYTRPVACSSAPPAQFWTYQNGYGTPNYCVYAGVHQMDGVPVPGDFEPMLYDCFYNMMDIGGEFRGPGSCATAVLGFWASEDDLALMFSVLQPGAVTPDSTSEAPYGIPVLAAVAMSQDPDDYGILLAWQDGDEIRCGHWAGEWNSYYHVVETGIQNLDNGDLAVCSVDSGYFIAWDTETVPEIRFVARDAVTCIEGRQSGASAEELLVSPNPVPAGCTVTAMVPGGTASQLLVYDLTGRLLLLVERAGSAPVTIDTSALFPGTYIVRAGSCDPSATRKLVVTGP